MDDTTLAERIIDHRLSADDLKWIESQQKKIREPFARLLIMLLVLNVRRLMGEH